MKIKRPDFMHKRAGLRVMAWPVLVAAGYLFLQAASLVQAGDEPLVISAGMQYDYALSCYTSQDYETAIVEFKRFNHFFPSHEKAGMARLKTGEALYYLERFHKAARVFNTIMLSNDDYDLQMAAGFMQGRCFEKLGNRNYAEVVFQNMLKLARDQDTMDRLYVALARIYIQKAKEMKPGALTKAEEFLDMVSPNGRKAYHVPEMERMLSAAGTAPQKNPAAAGILSVVPGLGYLYCERYKDAAMTFLINAGLILAAVKAHENDNDALAGVLFFVETGFYSGNVYGSLTAAHKYNRDLRMRIFDRQVSIAPRIDPVNGRIGLSFIYDF